MQNLTRVHLFRSVKEAVALFGERVVAGDVCNASRLQQLNRSRDEADHVTSKLDTMTVELKETKQNLQKTIDDGVLMAACLLNLQKELEQTKCELQQLKQKGQVPAEDDQVEDVKNVEDVTKFEAKPEYMIYRKSLSFRKTMLVLHMNHLKQFIVPEGDPLLERRPSVGKKKKKPLILLIAGIFSREKGNKGI